MVVAMNYGVSYIPDPQLEELRSSVPEPTLDELRRRAEEWAEKGSNLRLQNTLGDDVGFKLCVVVKKFIDGTPLDVSGNWQDFARCLQLDRWTIQRFENFRDIRGPTSAVLSEFAGSKDGTVGVLIKTLLELERFDILQEISHLVEGVLEPSAQVTQATNETTCEEHMDSGIYHSASFTGNAIVNSSVKAVATGHPSVIRKKKRKSVMLTFASDGREKVFQVAEGLRQQKLKVLILECNMDQLTEDPWLFIQKCFGYVDYIVPIVTEDYVAQISPGQNSTERPSMTHPDALYLRLIFNLMCAEYMNSGCKNYRIRALIDDVVIRSWNSYAVLKMPFFFTYHRIEEAPQLGRCLAKSKAQRPCSSVNPTRV